MTRGVKLVLVSLAALLPAHARLSGGASAQTATVDPARLTGGAAASLRPSARKETKLRTDLVGQGARHWDFEDGTLQGFRREDLPGAVAENNTFRNQPTLGHNVKATRALNTAGLRLPANPCAGLVLDAATTCEFGAGATYYYLARLRGDLDRLRTDLAVVGGDYWDVPFPIGTQGLYWIGTYEDRPSRAIQNPSVPGGIPRRLTLPWGQTQGDARTGRLISPEVELGPAHGYLHFLVGGGCGADVGVYLQARRPVLGGAATVNPAAAGALGDLVAPIAIGGGAAVSAPASASVVWETVRDAAGRPVEARGFCIENMVRTWFDIRNLRGTKVRILIEDRAKGSWGHINVDDIWLSSTPPRPSAREDDPGWGAADLHAHLVNEKGYTAYAADGRTPEVRVLWGSAFGGIETLRNCNDTHTTSDANYTSHQDEAGGTTYTLCRDMCLNLLEGAGLPEARGDGVDQDGALGGYHNTRDSGYPRFVNWPMWYSALHQQMHATWVRRAHQGGLRLMIAAVGNSEVIAFGMTHEKDRQFTSDQDAVALQIPAIKEFARLNATWTEVAYTPRDARRIMNAGKLAIVIGVEVDHVMDSCSADVTTPRHHVAAEYGHPDLWASQHGYDIGAFGTIFGISGFVGIGTRVMNFKGHPRTCTGPQIEARLDALYREGVRHVIPLHFSDNMLGGYAITGDLFVASAIFGDADARPPALMDGSALTGAYGDLAPRPEPTGDDATDRRRIEAWRAGMPISHALPSISVPMWARLGPETIVDTNVVPPGIGRTIAEFISGQCIDDEGWRIVAAILTGGGSEAGCAVNELTNAALDEIRDKVPYEGALDSALMIPLDLNAGQNGLPFHVNARGLRRPDGETFVGAMMKRGMLVDLQHASDAAKNDILRFAGSYPVLASHGGVHFGIGRASENVLSAAQMRGVYAPPSSFAGGVVGLGVQSSAGLVRQLRDVAGEHLGEGDARDRLLQTRGVALGTDFNGMDWHAPPRFGRFAFYRGDEGASTSLENERGQRLANERSRNLGAAHIGNMVNYAAYPAGSNPWAGTVPTCSPPCATWSTARAGHRALNAHQIRQGSTTTRTFDINYDGLAHYGLIPDFLQEAAVLGAKPEEMGTVFRSAEALIRMWEETCYLAYQMPSPPASLSRGCGDPGLYR
jgi:hypothetical protein